MRLKRSLFDLDADSGQGITDDPMNADQSVCITFNAQPQHPGFSGTRKESQFAGQELRTALTGKCLLQRKSDELSTLRGRCPQKMEGQVGQRRIDEPQWQVCDHLDRPDFQNA